MWSLRRRLLLGVSALPLALLTVPPNAARAQGNGGAGITSVVISGNGGTGYVLTPDQSLAQSNQNVCVKKVCGGTTASYTGSYNWSIGNENQETTYTDFNTTGGTGSGGGAGLGGVFFVGQNTSLTLTNVNFEDNSVTGGEGGGVRVDSVAPVALTVASYVTNASPITEFAHSTISTYIPLQEPSPLELGTVVLNGVTLPSSRSSQLVGLDSGVALVYSNASTGGILTPNAFDNYVSGITLNDDGSETLKFDQPIQLSVGNGLDKALLSLLTYRGEKYYVLLSASSSSTTAIEPGMQIVGPGIPADIVVDTVVENGAGDEVVGITAKYASNGKPYLFPEKKQGSFKAVYIVNASGFDFSRVAVDSNNAMSNTLTSTGSLGGIAVGMIVTGSGVPTGTTVTGVTTKSDSKTGADITTITLSQEVNVGEAATNLAAEYNPVVVPASKPNEAIITVSSTSGLGVGAQVTGVMPGGGTSGDFGVATGTTIIAINGNQITLSSNSSSPVFSQAAIDQIGNNALVLSVNPVSASSVDSITLASVVGFSVGDEISGGGVPANSQITSISGHTIKYTSNPALAGVNSGGAMNNLNPTGSAGQNGGDGFTGTDYSSTFDDGEGSVGGNGSSGGEASANGVGGNGGNGGSGTDGSSTNKTLITTLTFDVTSLASAIATTIAATTDPFTIPVGIADASSIVTATGSLAFTATQLAAWEIAEGQGKVALGGAGGAGGNGGNGVNFFGGGDGGVGGAGGNGAASNAIGGTGGTGGSGGAGGFGAGGGAGGAGGTSGANGAPSADGAAGVAGFGAGNGSVAGSGGQGGSGYGGAIFVRTGGSLTITGNSVFQNNAAYGGSSNNGGTAGQAAGSDLFMMTGSRVVLAPGTGHTITFDGTIADDSAASIQGASIAAGRGAGLTIADGGTVQLFGNDTYTGTTDIEGGTLEAQDGVGINADSHIQFAGTGVSLTSAGVLLSGGTFDRQLGAAPTQVEWQGSGGFAATSGDLTVNLGGNDEPLVWGQGSFVPNGSALLFGSDAKDATGVVTFDNAINLNGGTVAAGTAGQIAVYHNSGNAAGADAVLAGAVSGGELVVNGGGSGFAGTLLMPASNSLTGLVLDAGTLSTVDGKTIGRLMSPSGGYVTINGGLLVLGGPETLTNVQVGNDVVDTKTGTPDAIMQAFGNIQAGAINIGTDGAALYAASLTASAITNAGELDLMGPTTVAGEIDNKTTGVLTQTGDTTSHDAVNHGQWGLAADLTTTGDVTNDGKMAVVGVITASRGSNKITETATTRTITTQGFNGTGTVSLGGLTGVSNVLVINQSGDSTYAGTFIGAGGLTKAGAGDLTLTGANSFTGPLVIQAGTVDTTGGGTFAATMNTLVDQGATYIVGAKDSTALLENNGTTTVNAPFTLTALDNGASGLMTVNNQLYVTGEAENAGTMNFSDGSTGTFNKALINSGMLVSAGTLSVLGNFINQAKASATLGSTGSSAFTNLKNEGTLTASSSLKASGLVYNTTSGVMTLNGGSAPVFGRLENQGAITANDGLTVNGTYEQDAGSLTVNAANGVTTSLITGSFTGKGGAVILNGGGWSINQTKDGLYTGTVSGTGNVTKNGSATLVLAGGAGSFAPSSLAVQAGQVTVENADIFGGSETVSTGKGGTLEQLADQSIGSAQNAGQWDLDANLTTADDVTNDGTMTVIGALTSSQNSKSVSETATTRTITTQGFNGTGTVNLGGLTGVSNMLVINQSGASTYGGTFTGAGGLTKVGAGDLTLTGASSFTGPLLIQAGTVDTTDGGTFSDAMNTQVDQGATYIVGTNDSTANLVNNGTTTVNAALALAALDNGTTGLTNVNGQLHVVGVAENAGTMNFNAKSASIFDNDVGNSGTMNFNAGSTGTFNSNTGNSGTINVNAGATGTFDDGLSNGGKLVSAGTLSVLGNFINQATAQTMLGSTGSSTFANLDNAGTLTASSPLKASGLVYNATSGVMTFNKGSTPVFSSLDNQGAITANDGLTVTGAYEQDAGSLTVNAAKGVAPGLATGSLTGAGGTVILNGGGWSINQTTDGAYAGSIAGAGNVTKNGTGTLILAGVNEYTGGTVINAGTLLGTTTSFGTGPIIDNATLNIDESQDPPLLNALSGDGVFEKTGAGTVLIAGDDAAFNGTTQVLAGTLTIDGSLQNAKMQVANGGVLNGTGIVGSMTVENGGMVMPASIGTIGRMTVNGNYTQNNGGILRMSITPSTVAGSGYDQLIVTGDAQLAGPLAIQNSRGHYDLGSKYDILTAARGLRGSFDNLVCTPGFSAYITPKMIYSPNDAVLELTPGPMAFASGRPYVASSFVQTSALFNALGAPLVGPSVGDRADQGYWLHGLGSFGNASGYGINQKGFVTGKGFNVSPHLVIGGAISNLYTNTSDNTDQVSGMSVGGMVYGIHTAGPWTISGSFGVGYLSENIKRSLPIFEETARATSYGAYEGLMLHAAYNLVDNGRFSLSPYGALNYLHTRLGRAQDTGADSFDLRYDAITTNTTQLGAGLIGSYVTPTRHGTLTIWAGLGGIGTLGNPRVRNTETLETYRADETALVSPVAAVTPQIGLSLASAGQWRLAAAWTGQYSSSTNLENFSLQAKYEW